MKKKQYTLNVLEESDSHVLPMGEPGITLRSDDVSGASIQVKLPKQNLFIHVTGIYDGDPVIMISLKKK